MAACHEKQASAPANLIGAPSNVLPLDAEFEESDNADTVRDCYQIRLGKKRSFHAKNKARAGCLCEPKSGYSARKGGYSRAKRVRSLSRRCPRQGGQDCVLSFLEEGRRARPASYGPPTRPRASRLAHNSAFASLPTHSRQTSTEECGLSKPKSAIQRPLARRGRCLTPRRGAITPKLHGFHAGNRAHWR